MKYIAAAVATIALSVSAVGTVLADDKGQPTFGNSTVSGTIGVTASDSFGQAANVVAFLTF